jgi:hypothetical protein
MTTLVQPAYPFITVTVDTRGLVPVAQATPGVVAVVGDAEAGASAPAATPIAITDHQSALANFTKNGQPNALTRSLDTVLAQDPLPTTVYGVATPGAGEYAEALAGLDAADDVAFVCLAGETGVGTATTANAAATQLTALKEHVEQMSAAGHQRMAVAMVDPTIARSATYAGEVLAAYADLRSDDGRMILVAARGATTDAAAAAMGTIAGYPPATSMVLKQVRAVTMPLTSQYTPAEITELAGGGMIPLIDPALIPGTGLFFADAGTFSSDAARNYIDIVRFLDDISFRLRAGLIGTVGDARITKAGLTALRVRIEGILGPFAQAGVIENPVVTFPLLAILSTDEGSRSADDAGQLATARATRQVTARIRFSYASVVQQIDLTLTPTFA